jgi:UPF0755 protein
VTPKMIKNDKSEYNSYKKKGIPNNPVSAVGFDAIKAAIFPAKTKYLYFMKSRDGKYHNFSSTYKNHKKNIKKVVNYKNIKKLWD